MSIWEKLGLKKTEKIDVTSEIYEMESQIQDLAAKIPWYEQSMQSGDLTNTPINRGNIENMKRELQGLKDKLALFQEKQRREGEKVGRLNQ